MRLWQNEEVYLHHSGRYQTFVFLSASKRPSTPKMVIIKQHPSRGLGFSRTLILLVPVVQRIIWNSSTQMKLYMSPCHYFTTLLLPHNSNNAYYCPALHNGAIHLTRGYSYSTGLTQLKFRCWSWSKYWRRRRKVLHRLSFLVYEVSHSARIQRKWG